MTAKVTPFPAPRHSPGIAALLAALSVPAQGGSTVTISASFYKTLTEDTVNVAKACYDQGRHDALQAG